MKISIKFENVPATTNHIDLIADNPSTEFDDGYKYLCSPDYQAVIDLPDDSKFILKARAFDLKGNQLAELLLKDWTGSDILIKF